MSVPEPYVNILQAMVQAQGAQRQRSPVRIPYEAGTPTLGRQQLDQQAVLAREQTELERALAEQQAILTREKMAQDAALTREQMALQRSLASMRSSGSGGSGGGYSVPSTAGEREAFATATLLQEAHNRYKELKSKGYKYPLYYTISSVLNDPQWRSPAEATGVDLKRVIDSLVTSISRKSPDEYFKGSTGSRLNASYSALDKKSSSGGSIDWRP